MVIDDNIAATECITSTRVRADNIRVCKQLLQQNTLVIDANDATAQRLHCTACTENLAFRPFKQVWRNCI